MDFENQIFEERRLKMSRTRIEQETTILMNAEEKTVEIYSADPIWIRKLDKLCETAPDYWKVVKVQADSKTYIGTDKNFVSLRSKPRPGHAPNQRSLDNLKAKRNRKSVNG